jgi:hypothetical protein
VVVAWCILPQAYETFHVPLKPDKPACDDALTAACSKACAHVAEEQEEPLTPSYRKASEGARSEPTVAIALAQYVIRDGTAVYTPEHAMHAIQAAVGSAVPVCGGGVSDFTRACSSGRGTFTEPPSLLPAVRSALDRRAFEPPMRQMRATTSSSTTRDAATSLSTCGPRASLACSAVSVRLQPTSRHVLCVRALL